MWIIEVQKNDLTKPNYTQNHYTIGHIANNWDYYYCKQCEFRMLFFKADFFSNILQEISLLTKMTFRINFKLPDISYGFEATIFMKLTP